MILLTTLEDNLLPYIQNWAEGRVAPLPWNREVKEKTLWVLKTPGSWPFIVAFVEQNPSCSWATPLILLKNALPLYEPSWPTLIGPLEQAEWLRIKRGVTFHNPGLVRCLTELESRFFNSF